jgi:hypothetical protein
MPTCAQCGAAIQRKSTGPIATYCSTHCRRRAAYERDRSNGRYAAMLDARRETRQPTSHERTCAVCAAAFQAKRRDTKYCSRSCARKGAEPCTEPGCKRPSCVATPRRLCSTHYNAANYTPEQRREQRTQPRACAHCGSDYMAQRSSQRYCSLVCRSGGEFRRTYTDEERRRCREATRKRRALLRSVECEDFTEREIYERDGWCCQLCGKRVSQKLRWPHPMSASLDHVIPLTKDGTSHTRRNVRLAHLVCNTKRGNRGGAEQLALIG